MSAIDEHPTEAELDALEVGELGAAEADALRQHLADCTVCRGVRAERAALRLRFETVRRRREEARPARPLIPAHRAVAPSRRRRGFAWVAGGALAASVLALPFLRPAGPRLELAELRGAVASTMGEEKAPSRPAFAARSEVQLVVTSSEDLLPASPIVYVAGPGDSPRRRVSDVVRVTQVGRGWVVRASAADVFSRPGRYELIVTPSELGWLPGPSLSIPVDYLGSDPDG